jgi:hypothetical protein
MTAQTLWYLIFLVEETGQLVPNVRVARLLVVSSLPARPLLRILGTEILPLLNLHFLLPARRIRRLFVAPWISLSLAYRRTRLASKSAEIETQGRECVMVYVENTAAKRADSV